MDDRRWCVVVADSGPLGDPRRFCSGLILLKSLIFFVSFHAAAATKQFSGATKHPESVCGCLMTTRRRRRRPGFALGVISEAGVPTIETEWVPAAQQ